MSLSRRALLAGAGVFPLGGARAAGRDAIVCPLAAAPSVLVPGLSGGLATRVLGGMIYRGLLRFDSSGPQPDLAAAWEVSDDELSYVFHLLPGVTWHDGGGLSPADVVFSLGRFHRLLQPRLGLDRAVVRAEGERAVVLTLKQPFPPLLRLLDASCAPIVPQHVHDRPGWALDPAVAMPVGCGPFRVAEWLRLVRFDWFAGPAPVLREIVCPIGPDRLALLDGGPGLLMDDAPEPSLVARLRQSPGLAVEADVPPTAAMLAGIRLNLAAKPLDDRRVRLALASAVDRGAVLRQVWLGLGKEATGPTASGSKDRNAAAVLPAFDLRAASAQLNAAGLRPDDDGIRLRLTHLVQPGAAWGRLAALLRAALGRVGVEVVAEAVTEAEWSRRVAAGDYQSTGFAAEQTGDPLIDLAAYSGEAPELAPLLTPEWPAAIRAAATAKAQAMLADEVIRLWLVEPATLVARDKRLHLPGGLYGSFAAATLD